MTRRSFVAAIAAAIVILGAASATSVKAQTPSIRYDVSWGEPNDHWLDVVMRVSNVRSGELEVRIPYWRPGRYVVQNFARNITGASAATASGSALVTTKVDRNTWRVSTGGASEVVISYRVWANQLDAGASYVGQGKLSLNPVTAMMFVPGREMEPVAISLATPDDWDVATALDYDASIGAWRAADYHELVDSPMLAGTGIRTHAFDLNDARIEIVVEGDWTYDADTFVEHHRKLVTAQTGMMQDVPFKRFVFLYQFVPMFMGHGVEHKNSTSIVLGPPSMLTFPDDLSNPGFYGALLSVASHEFFHAWNVERIRPASMTPTDYGREQYTSLMWAFEGTTDYYADLMLLRAGLSSPERFLESIAGTVGAFDADPGRKVTPVAMSSFDSWAKDDGAAPPFTFYSYYTAGKAMGLALDLEVRGRTQGRRSLDDVMRLLNERYGKTGKGVPEDGFLKAVEEVSGTSFRPFFSSHIDGMEDVDWDSHLKWVGMRLVRTPNADRLPKLGVTLDGMKITGVMSGGSADRAGLDIDDVIVSVNGSQVKDPSVSPFAGIQPGSTVRVTVERWGVQREVDVTLDASDPTYSFVEVDNATPAQVALREAWLRAGH